MSVDRMKARLANDAPTRGDNWLSLGARIRQAVLAAAALHVCRDSWLTRENDRYATHNKETSAARSGA